MFSTKTWVPAPDADCKFFACAASHLQAHVDPACNGELSTRGALYRTLYPAFLAHSGAHEWYFQVTHVIVHAQYVLCFSYVMARFEPAIQVAAHAKISTLYVR